MNHSNYLMYEANFEQESIFEQELYLEKIINIIFGHDDKAWEIILKSKMPFDYTRFEKVDPIKMCLKIDKFVRKNPNKKYSQELLIKYLSLQVSIKKYVSELIPNYNYDERNLNDYPQAVFDLFAAVDYITEYLKGLLNPEDVIQEQPQKFEKLKPIEKILIIHYLKIDSLKPINSQLHIKPGIHFISRLFDINTSSIKDAVLKIANYTTDDNSGKLPKIEANTANQYIPILKNVKSFFEDSDLKNISKEVGKRIEVLNEISGKNF
jgi:hypothetical protein